MSGSRRVQEFKAPGMSSQKPTRQPIGGALACPSQNGQRLGRTGRLPLEKTAYALKLCF